MTSEKSDVAARVAAAAEQRAAMLGQLVARTPRRPDCPIRRPAGSATPLSLPSATRRRATMRASSSGEQRELIEVAGADGRVGEESSARAPACVPARERRDGRDVLLGERAHDEARAVLDRRGGRRSATGIGRDVVDAQARPRAGSCSRYAAMKPSRTATPTASERPDSGSSRAI